MEAIEQMVATLGAMLALLTSALCIVAVGHFHRGDWFMHRDNSAGLGYVDLILVHWPGVARKRYDSAMHAQMRLETWTRLEEAHQSGVARSIGALQCFI